MGYHIISLRQANDGKAQADAENQEVATMRIIDSGRTNIRVLWETGICAGIVLGS